MSESDFLELLTFAKGGPTPDSESKIIIQMYDTLIRRSQTPESFPYLAQAAESKFIVREDKPFQEGEKEMIDEYEETNEKHYTEYGDRYNDSTVFYCGKTIFYYNLFAIPSYFRYRQPFAELAKKRLSEILPQIQNPSQQQIAKELIQRKEEKENFVKEYHQINTVLNSFVDYPD